MRSGWERVDDELGRVGVAEVGGRDAWCAAVACGLELG
jgi:hypothetical protein